MIVTWENFQAIVEKLSLPGERSVDTETTGVRPFHGNSLFSLIIGDADEEYYFNFQDYPSETEVVELPDGNGGTYKDEIVTREGINPEHVLDRSFLALMKPIFANPLSSWAAHNAKFDLHMLANEGIEIAGEIHCTKAIALLEYNEHFKYDLASCAERIGHKKDDAVEEYIKTHKLSRKEEIPGKKTRATIKYYDRVPPEIIIPYGCTDAKVTRHLKLHQSQAIQKISEETPHNVPRLSQVFENEKRLTKTIYKMERVGLQLNIPYCKEAAEYEMQRASEISSEFRALAGEDYSESPKLFARIFESEKEKWKYTELGNPSFEGDTIRTFNSPLAKLVVSLRDTKSKANFYNGFLYHADSNGRIHPTLNQDGAGHGRFSSSEPNMQNLKKDKEKALAADKYIVRRAIIPSPGYSFLALDYAQVEYRLALDVAGEMGLISQVKQQGLDVHTAVAQFAGITRDQAKAVNFGLLYGQGDGLLAESLGVTRAQARAIREQVLGAMPRVDAYNQGIMRTAATRGFIFNWFGRRCYFPHKQFAYRALNYAIAGGAADVVKIAMNRLDDLLMPYKSRMIWNVHDELLFELWPGEEFLIPQIKEIMERAYPSRYLTLECGVDYGNKPWSDLEEYSVSKMGVAG